jgi:hypothetical protein
VGVEPNPNKGERPWHATQTKAATKKPANPSYIAYAVTEKGSDQDKKSFWTRIGAAWDHDDGERMTLQLERVPVNGGRRSRKD